MTRFEQLKAAYPVHIDRIMELVESIGDHARPGMYYDEPSPHRNAGWCLAGCFQFGLAEEGFDFWDNVARSGGWVCS